MGLIDGNFIGTLKGFATKNKIPTNSGSWRDKSGWTVVSGTFFSHRNIDQMGIVPGEHGCVVLDIDKKGTFDGEKSIIEKFGMIPTSLWYKTQSGGYHIWYKVPEETTIKQSNGRLPGVDIRYKDGYVCINRDYDIKGELIDCPKNILDWLVREPTPKVFRDNGAKATTRFDLSPIPIGERNNRLYAWGYGIVQGVNNKELTEQDLHDLIHLRGRISGLPFWECENILSSLLVNVVRHDTVN